MSHGGGNNNVALKMVGGEGFAFIWGRADFLPLGDVAQYYKTRGNLPRSTLKSPAVDENEFPEQYISSTLLLGEKASAPFFTHVQH